MPGSRTQPHETIDAASDWVTMDLGSFTPQHIGWGEVLLRIGLAVLLPLMIGLERFLRKKPIDFRPFVVISVAACGLSLASLELAQTSFDQQIRIDPTRVFEGVITGIGFLGAGAMFRQENYVMGAGSASAIWAAGAIGLMCGLGMLWLSVAVTVPILLVLILSAPFVERYDPENTRQRQADGDEAVKADEA